MKINKTVAGAAPALPAPRTIGCLGWLGLVCLLLGGPVPAFPRTLDYVAVDEEMPGLRGLEDRLDGLRQELRIPGLAAGVMKDGQLVWAKGFGWADLENRIEATPDTPWHIASVAKTFAAVVVLQLIEEGRLGLDDPLSDFGIRFAGRKGIVRVRHILSHTSESRPGAFFRYSGRLWEHLARVIEAASGRSYKDNLVDRIIVPLGLTDTAPNKETETEDYAFSEIRSRLAVPYGMDRTFRPRRSDIGLGFYAAGGTFSSVRDLARFSAALDNGRLLDHESVRMMFNPQVSPGGRVHPHGLGWFCQDFGGTRVVWHFGWHPDHYSALIVKVPAKGLTFVALANSDMLSRPFNLLRGNVLDSPAALLFMRMIAFPGEDIPELEAKSSETSDIVLKASGRKPVVGPFALAILGFCLIVFLSAPVLWASLWVRRKVRRPDDNRPPGRNGPATVMMKAFALICALLGLLVMGVLLKAPFLVYWPELPGWIDGISDAENIALFLPTILAVLAAALCLLALWAWKKEYWSVLERVHFTVLAATTAGFALLLDHWHLVGLSYYWNYLLR